MKINKFVVAGGVIALAVVGYFLFVPKAYPPGSLVCDAGPCIVPVSVTDCVPKPDFDPIIVLKKHGATNIFWEAPVAHTFTDPDGIKFKDNNDGDINTNPPGGARINGGARWHVVDNPAHKVQIHYRIEVETNGKVCTGPDPVIWNE